MSHSFPHDVTDSSGSLLSTGGPQSIVFTVSLSRVITLRLSSSNVLHLGALTFGFQELKTTPC